jgi:hypothetical protein
MELWGVALEHVENLAGDEKRRSLLRRLRLDDCSPFEVRDDVLGTLPCDSEHFADLRNRHERIPDQRIRCLGGLASHALVAQSRSKFLA